MATPRIFESEYRFCQLLWENEPIRSGALVALCRERLNWKPTTTYTVIRRLSERGVVKNENCVVTSLVSRAEAESAEVGELLETRFNGSMPAFISAFSRLDRVSDADMDELLRMIRQYREENHDASTPD